MPSIVMRHFVIRVILVIRSRGIVELLSVIVQRPIKNHSNILFVFNRMEEET